MVNVRKKFCSHDSCIKQATFNVGGIKTPVYCRQHAEEGMVDVRNKLCSYNLCMRQPTFGFGVSKTPVYCKQHAVDGMINVRRQLCSLDSCMKLANFNVEGIKTPVYCQQHAEKGMVNVRSKRSLPVRPTTKPARGASTNPATMASTGHTMNVSGGSGNHSDESSNVLDCRKRSRLVVDVKHPPHFLGHGAVKEEGVVQPVGINGSEESPRRSYSRSLRRNLKNETVRTVAKHTGLITPHTVAHAAERHRPGKLIKNEMEPAVFI
ncbi:unnamed protein product [Laminaria digitata]